VKAKITNGSQNTDLNNVSATLNWNADANVELVEGNQTLNGDSHSCTKLVGNITAGTSGEITLELRCTGGGEVYFNVYASVTSPLLTVYSAPNSEFPPYTVNVHQIGIPTACLDVTILSPDNKQSDNPDNNGQVMIATGQQFALSAKVYNEGPDAAANVVATLDPSCEHPGGFVSLADGQSDTINLGTIDDGNFLVATWTLVGGGGNDWGLKDCSVRTDDICVNATTDTNTTCDASDNVEVSIYPAAFLVATIDSITPSSPITLGNEFTVDYTVTNYGVADATSVVATLSADSKVSPAAGTGGYTHPLGTIPGWGFGDVNSVDDSFQLQCTAAGLSTLNISLSGQDECGWQPVLGWTTWQKYYYWDGEDPGPNGVLNKEDTNIQWVQLGLSPIYSGFLAPASETIAQRPSGGADLSITKTVDNATPSAGQIVNFTVTVTNNGPADATGIAVTDNQPSGLTFGAAIASQGSFASGVWTVGNIVAGSSATLMIPATVTNAASPITNTASITAADQFDPNPMNNSASVTLNGGKVTSVNVTLSSGWNLISLPLIPGNDSIGVVLAGVSSHVASVWSYSGGVWTWWQPGNAGSTLLKMDDGWGYWINMNSAATLSVSGVVNPLANAGTPPTYAVVPGWNLIGFKSTTAQTAGDYLAAIAGQWTKIWGYASGQYSAVTSSGMLQPGYGYWIAVTSAGTIFP